MCRGPHHCPFLNRADGRCAKHLSLDNLQYALEYCFDQYQQCPVYLERLVERRLRRSLPSVLAAGKISKRDAAAGFVQISLPHRNTQRSADPAELPAAPGV